MTSNILSIIQLFPHHNTGLTISSLRNSNINRNNADPTQEEGISLRMKIASTTSSRRTISAPLLAEMSRTSEAKVRAISGKKGANKQQRKFCHHIEKLQEGAATRAGTKGQRGHARALTRQRERERENRAFAARLCINAIASGP